MKNHNSPKILIHHLPFITKYLINFCYLFSLSLQNSRRRPVRGLLHVSGDGLRVVDDETKGLIVDQTIEKVSFCAPDRNHERGFSYICRDGTTRRWMCHGFLACKDSGERLSHAVGCAFAVCLERKQRRDKECGVTMTFDTKNNTFTRTGSFRTQTMTERFANNERGIDTPSALIQPQSKPFNPFAIERPHATPMMLERQGSFRAFSTIGSQSPFKRQMSLRINDLPSNAERQKAFLAAAAGNALGLNTPNRSVSPIPEVSPGRPGQEMENGGMGTDETVSQLCQELSQGLTLLSQNDAALAGSSGATDDLNFNNNMSINQNIIAAEKHYQRVISSPTSTSSYGIVTPTAHVTPRLASVSPAILNTPPQTPSNTPTLPTSADKMSSLADATLPKPDQWLGQIVKSTSPAPLKRGPLITTAGRTQSMSSVPGSNDPFDAEWVAGVTKPLSPDMPAAADSATATPVHSTNPFISPPKAPAQTFQVQL